MGDMQKLEGNAIRYFQTIFELLENTQVTGRQGEVILLNDGGDRAAQTILSLLATSNKAMILGNGGSAALASHTQNDLCKAVGVPAQVFTESSILTALTNDNGYDTAFEYQMNLFAKPGDLVIAISSSGRSKNILRASKVAQDHGCQLITLTGFHPDNPLRKLGNLNFYIPVDDYGLVESAHAVLLHFFTDQAISIKKGK